MALLAAATAPHSDLGDLRRESTVPSIQQGSPPSAPPSCPARSGARVLQRHPRSSPVARVSAGVVRRLRPGDQPGQEQVTAAVRRLQGVQEERGATTRESSGS
uniref:Uncharacterized protein n=1 Tax=Triticum urartu TaxID=4572 RepID=A0A8R7R3C3_TRIUA